MGEFALLHWGVVLGIIALFVWLPSRILRKAGLSGWWAFLSLVPAVNFVMIWVFAFVDWPNERKTEARETDFGGP